MFYMKKSRFLVLFFLNLTALFGAFAQTQDDINLQKYWYYRWRLVNDFVKVGEGVGHSIPIQSRQGYNGIPDIEVADATIYHGFYLAILASELKLLEINERHQDLEFTKTELYYAIKAYERLDLYGEQYLGLPGKIDGCFQRDDIPCDFLDPNVNPENYRHFNQGFHNPPGFSPVFKVFTSDDCPDGRALENKSLPRKTPSMSQDQVIWLLMGFMMIEKCTSGIQQVRLHHGQVVDYDFNTQARRHATNMINYCKYKYPEKPKKANWRLFRPDGKKIYPGQNVFMFKYPLSEIGERMYYEGAENNQRFDRKTGRGQWKLTRIWIPYKNVNGQMITVLGALSGKWGRDELRTMNAIEKTWKKRNWGNFYLPLMAVLHDIDLNHLDIHERVQADLNLAPAVGPYNLTRDEIARFADSLGIKTYPIGWTRHLKYSSSFLNQMNGELDNYMRRGFYSGLDFMLLFNLYYLTNNKPLPTYHNLIHRYFGKKDLNDANLQNQARFVGAFATLNIVDFHVLDSIKHVRVGTDYFFPRPNMAAAAPKTEFDVEPFNPWQLQDAIKNNYGWAEFFPLKNHFELLKPEKPTK